MKLLDFIFAARPLLHLPIWSVFLICLHYHHQLSGDVFSYENLIILIGMSFLVSGAYYINQIYDYESDKINDKLGFLQSGKLTFRQLWIGYFVITLIPIVISFFISTLILMVFLQFFVLGFLYSSKPFQFKNRPILGLLTNAYSFGWLVPLTVMPEINIHNVGLLKWGNPLYFFLAVAAIHIMTTIPDRDGDLKTGKKTIAVIMPPVSSKLLAVALLVASIVVAYQSEFLLLSGLSLVSSLVILLSLFYSSNRLCLLATKLPILLLTLLAGYFYIYYLLFIVVLFVVTRIYYKRRFGIKYPQIA
ncbi:MAG: hypothetical protein DRP35_03655 [Candidatus Zixiibacteriota bacterium]|nr:MAG: hypothetical protein DRP35_03655 [candidate division Zixibacteria bacterium]